MEKNVSDGNVAGWLDNCVQLAVKYQASDIHIEPLLEERQTRIRVRIDGLLEELDRVTITQHSSIISRVKVMSGMDIGESRVPQDGRWQLYVDKRKIELRVSTMPTVGGEKAVLRILDNEHRFIALDKLCFSENNGRIFRRIIENKHGLVLLTGPTGSGKTTTLYATLQELNQEDKNIVTIENPVEYVMQGVNQVSVNEKSGMSFAVGLRAMLRQDPDIVMVGEIRDRVTAEVAVQAALTGHLVLSTLHTNDAWGTINRLLDMGIEKYLLVAALKGAVAQRLVRKLCTNCKAEREATSTEKAYMGFSTSERCRIFYGKGCEVCRNTGYKGRIAIQEVLPLSEELIKTREEELSAKNKSVELHALKEDGIVKILKGETTLEELWRVGIY